MGSPQDATPGSSAESRVDAGGITSPPAGAFGLFRGTSFGLYLFSRFFAVTATQMVSVAIGWHVYDLTGDPLALGFTGLAQFLTMALLAPITGSVADRFDRRIVLAVCHLLYAGCALALTWIARRPELGVTPIYAVLAVIGGVRAFWMPSGQAILPSLVGREDFPRAVAWASSNFQVALILGPALGGTLLALGAPMVFVLAAAVTVLSMVLILLVRLKSEARAATDVGWRSLLAGVSFVRSRPVILGAISLDLFAVLLGGAIALMPYYADEILLLGPVGLGLLRAAPGVGAGLVGLYLAFHPIRRAAGRRLFACVALFGIATIVFGLSRNAALSIFALVVLGAADMVSVVIRQTIVQIRTPDEMRGRVAAVNIVFISASNELGEFESGLTGKLLGNVPAVVLGGVGTLVVTLLWTRWFPELWRIERAEDMQAVELNSEMRRSRSGSIGAESGREP